VHGGGGVEDGGLLEVLLGVADLPLLVEELGQVVIGLRPAGVQLDEALKLRDGVAAAAGYLPGQLAVALLVRRGERRRRRGERGVLGAVLLLYLQVFQGGEVSLARNGLLAQAVKAQELGDVDEGVL